MRYRTFRVSNGEYIRSTTDFYTALEGKSFIRQKTRSGIVTKCIKLNPTGTDPQDEFPDFLTQPTEQKSAGRAGHYLKSPYRKD